MFMRPIKNKLILTSLLLASGIASAEVPEGIDKLFIQAERTASNDLIKML